MNNGSVGGAIIMALCCFGCAGLFAGIGTWAGKTATPVHFWAGTVIDPEKVSDIPAYNKANARMWLVYSVPYWLAGSFSCLGFLGDVFIIVAAAVLFAACFPGIFLLIRSYRKIGNRFIRN